MMVCLPPCNIDCPVYIWWIESKQWQFYKRYPHLSPHLQIRSSVVHPYLPQPHCWAIKKESIWNNLAWWPLPASSIPMPPLCPTTNHHHATLLLTLSLLFLEISFFPIKFSRYHFSDKILEISLVFTHGITPGRVNHNRCFVKKCILMFSAMHGHLASYRRRPHAHLAAGCATDPNSKKFRRLGAPDVVPRYKM